MDLSAPIDLDLAPFRRVHGDPAVFLALVPSELVSMTMVVDYEHISVSLKLRRAAAWPLYLLAFLLSLLSDAIGDLAAWIAGDTLPSGFTSDRIGGTRKLAMDTYILLMPGKPKELPPEVAQRFFEGMRAFLVEKNAIKRDEIAARQLHALEATFSGQASTFRRERDVPADAGSSGLSA
jgi:hypothetical protein